MNMCHLIQRAKSNWIVYRNAYICDHTEKVKLKNDKHSGQWDPRWRGWTGGSRRSQLVTFCFWGWGSAVLGVHFVLIFNLMYVLQIFLLYSIFIEHNFEVAFCKTACIAWFHWKYKHINNIQERGLEAGALKWKILVSLGSGTNEYL